VAKLIPGINDFATLYPEIAAEADGWDPSKFTCGVNTPKDWKCKKSHTYPARIPDRCRGRGCPFCSNTTLLVGFNDLKTKFPEIAKEAF